MGPRLPRDLLDQLLVATGEHDLVTGPARQLDDRPADALAASGDEKTACLHEMTLLSVRRCAARRPLPAVGPGSLAASRESDATRSFCHSGQMCATVIRAISFSTRRSQYWLLTLPGRTVTIESPAIFEAS